MATKTEAGKKDHNLQHKIYCSCVAGGLALFLLISALLPSNTEYARTEYGTSVSSSSTVTLTLLDWQYNPRTRYTEAIFSVQYSKDMTRPSFVSSAFDAANPGTEIPAAVAFWQDNTLIVSVESLPKDWRTLSLYVQDDTQITGELQDTKSGAKFQCNSKEIQSNTTLLPKTEADYLMQAVMLEISGFEEIIQTAQQTIADNKVKSEQLEQEILSLTAAQKYQTEAELQESDRQISAMELQTEKMQADCDAQEDLIAQQNDKIAMRRLKLEEMQG